MSEASCVLCSALAGLRNAEQHVQPSGEILRRIADLPVSLLVLSHDQYYTGHCLLIAKTHATELYHLPAGESVQYCQDMTRAARAIAAACNPRKMNYELLGNTVPHLHWHLVPRHPGDPNPTRPIWENVHEPRIPGPAEASRTVAAIRHALG